jgi:ABC-type antimicrobial peptide transport system ATPase subunit
MKIPLQEKIAELEGRIRVLEEKPCRCRVVEKTTVITSSGFSKPDLEKFHAHWHEMWKHFDLAIKSFFKGEA